MEGLKDLCNFRQDIPYLIKLLNDLFSLHFDMSNEKDFGGISKTSVCLKYNCKKVRTKYHKFFKSP